MKKSNFSDLSKQELINEIIKLNKRTKYGLVWEDKKEDVIEKLSEQFPFFIENKDKQIVFDKDYPFNYVIEGDNYQSLAVLNYTHKKKD
jgi:adenine-specific DNA-methyltransferase